MYEEVPLQDIKIYDVRLNCSETPQAQEEPFYIQYIYVMWHYIK